MIDVPTNCVVNVRVQEVIAGEASSQLHHVLVGRLTIAKDMESLKKTI